MRPARLTPSLNLADAGPRHAPGITHTAIILRGAGDKILDILELEPNETVTPATLAAIWQRPGVRKVETVTTTERRAS